jgi:hypothetical protein
MLNAYIGQWALEISMTANSLAQPLGGGHTGLNTTLRSLFTFIRELLLALLLAGTWTMNEIQD